MTNKPYSEACEQNCRPILAVLKKYLAENKNVLEIGSGTGQHAAFFPKEMTHLYWQPSDIQQHINGIEAWRIEADLSNVKKCIELDVNQENWPEANYDAIFSANTAHIMAWPEVEKFIVGVGKLLNQNQSAYDKYFCLYGPFNYNGRYTSESNANFDQWLIQQNPNSAIRHFEEINKLAESNNLQLIEDIEMPANNRILIFSTP